MKISTGQEYAAKIINTKKLSARGEYMLSDGASTSAAVLTLLGRHSGTVSQKTF